jgi:hypothetical protein
MLGPDQRTLITRPIAHPDGSKHAGYGTPTSCSNTGPEMINRLVGLQESPRLQPGLVRRSTGTLR